MLSFVSPLLYSCLTTLANSSSKPHSASPSIKDRHGVYAMINKDERRDVSIRKPRPSIRKQLAGSKQATSPKKAAARTKKNELEV